MGRILNFFRRPPVIMGSPVMSVLDDSLADFYSRRRTAPPEKLFDNKNVGSRFRSLWEEPIVNAILTHGAVTGGPFVVETFTGGTSGSEGAITTVGVGQLTYNVNHDDFVVGETITGDTSGATAVITDTRLGSTIEYELDTSGVILKVGTGADDSAARVTHLYIPHVPGTIQESFQTFTLEPAAENVERTVGYGYLQDGLFLVQRFDSLYFLHRTSTSGAPVDTLIAQADWNVDKFDGTGPSGKTLDVTKHQFLFIEFAWQGSGPVSMHFFVDGQFFTAHTFRFFNSTAVPFMKTPSLPIFYGIKNLAATSIAHTMREFCSSVISGGGSKVTGLGYGVSTEGAEKNISAGGSIPVIAVRLKNSLNGGDNRRTLKFLKSEAFPTANNIHYEVKHVHDPKDIESAPGVPAIWSDVGAGSVAEFSTDINSFVGAPTHDIVEGYAASGQAGKGIAPATATKEDLDQHRLISQNIDSTNSELFVLMARPMNSASGNTFCAGALDWLESG